MRFLEIIVPQYKENDEIVESLLKSIDRQINIDFNDIEVTIINDGSNVLLSDELINKYSKLNISYIKNNENLGAGPIRQRAVDLTKSKYITFVDADDELANERSLELIISCLKDTNKDLLITNVSVEKLLDGKKVLIDKYYGMSDASLHGKFIKREYLEKNGIRFSNELKNFYEDSYYCMTLVGADPLNISGIHLNFSSYIWRLNFSSITKNTKKDYFVETIDDYVKCIILTSNFLIDKKSIMATPYIMDAIMFVYQMINSKIFKGIDINEYMTSIINLYKNNKDELKKLDKKKDMYDRAYKRLVDYRDKETVGYMIPYNRFIKEIDQA